MGESEDHSIEEEEECEENYKKCFDMYRLLFNKSMSGMDASNHKFVQLMNLCNIENYAVVLMDNEHKILHANSQWMDRCGYDLFEVVGKKLSILQGPRTNLEKVHKFLDNLYKVGFASVTLLNFTKENSPFWNSIWATKFNCCEETYFIGISEIKPT